MIDDFFRNRLDQTIDLRHPLAVLIWLQIVLAVVLTAGKSGASGLAGASK